jgi:hypothetical protein
MREQNTEEQLLMNTKNIDGQALGREALAALTTDDIHLVGLFKWRQFKLVNNCERLATTQNGIN